MKFLAYQPDETQSWAVQIMEDDKVLFESEGAFVDADEALRFVTTFKTALEAQISSVDPLMGPNFEIPFEVQND